MAILVTGGAGYIGSHTCLLLKEAGYDLVVVDNYCNSSPEALKRVETLTGQTIKTYEADLLNVAALERVFIENTIEGVIHFAGLKAVGESVVQPLRYYQNNLTGTLNLCALMVKYGVKRMVFSSSATVYGMDNPSPLTEAMPTGSATNPYGWSKLMIEQILRDMTVSNPDFCVALLRYFNPVGAHESGQIGEAPSGIPNNLMPYVTQVAIGKREHLSVFGNDYETHDGTGVRDYIHVMDLAEGHLKALEKIETTQGVVTYNLGTGVGYSVLDLIQSFTKATGIEVPYTVTHRRPGDIAECYADPSKASNELGWKAKRSLEDMCRDAWRWQSQNPNGY